VTLIIRANLQGRRQIDFDKKKVRKAMRKVGRDVRAEARRLVARQAIFMPIGSSLSVSYEGSKAGEYPARNTGKMQESIKEKVSRSGFAVSISPQRDQFERDDYYPAMLYYGVKGKSGYRIAPRKNFIVDAVESRRASAEAAIFQALKESLKGVNEF
jgi:hypothetical protein